MRAERGLTLTELLTVMAVGSLVTVAGVTYSLPWLARETMRSAMHDVQAALQIAKMEAASRNSPCRLVVNTTTGAVRVWDTLATSSTTDDRLLYDKRLPHSVGFDRPDPGAIVTLPQVGMTTSYETSFTAQGLAQGTGDVFLVGGDRYGRVSVHAAGGVELGMWTGDSWRSGS